MGGPSKRSRNLQHGASHGDHLFSTFSRQTWPWTIDLVPLHSRNTRSQTAALSQSDTQLAPKPPGPGVSSPSRAMHRQQGRVQCLRGPAFLGYRPPTAAPPPRSAGYPPENIPRQLLSCQPMCYQVADHPPGLCLDLHQYRGSTTVILAQHQQRHSSSGRYFQKGYLLQGDLHHLRL